MGQEEGYKRQFAAVPGRQGLTLHAELCLSKCTPGDHLTAKAHTAGRPPLPHTLPSTPAVPETGLALSCFGAIAFAVPSTCEALLTRPSKKSPRSGLSAPPSHGSV